MTADQGQENVEKAMSEQLADILEQLSFDQKRFIIARQETSTDKEAAEAIGIKPETVYRWRQEQSPIDEALSLMAHDGLVMALHLRRKSLAKAMAIKVGGLDEEDNRLRQGVATEIIEWEMGKAGQKMELSGKDGEPLAIKAYIGVSPDDWPAE